MNKPIITRKMQRRLEKVKKKGYVIDMKTDEVREMLGIEGGVPILGFYMSSIGMTYDWKQKVWRKKRPVSSPYHRSITKLQQIKEKYGLDFDVKELFNGGRRVIEDL
jgi:hypothetical protein